MQITQIIQYAGMMVLHKGMMESQFIILLGKEAHFYQDTKASPHSIYSHKCRAWSEQRLQSPWPLSKSLTLPVHWLSLCNAEITLLPPFKQGAGGIKIPRLRGVKSLDDEVSALSK